MRRASGRHFDWLALSLAVAAVALAQLDWVRLGHRHAGHSGTTHHHHGHAAAHHHHGEELCTRNHRDRDRSIQPHQALVFATGPATSSSPGSESDERPEGEQPEQPAYFDSPLLLDGGLQAVTLPETVLHRLQDGRPVAESIVLERRRTTAEARGPPVC